MLIEFDISIIVFVYETSRFLPAPIIIKRITKIIGENPILAREFSYFSIQKPQIEINLSLFCLTLVCNGLKSP